MLKHYMVIAWRQLKRHALFSTLNIFCLATGIGICILIGEYVAKERSVNSHLRDLPNLYFLQSEWKIKGTGPEFTTVGPLVNTLHRQYPSLVSNYYRMNPVTNTVSAGEQHFKENIAMGDTTLISMFGFTLLQGNPANAFPNNRSALITETMAHKLFANNNAMGQTIRINNSSPGWVDYVVSGILKDMPNNTVNNYLGKDGYSVFIPLAGNQYYTGGSGEEGWNNFFTVAFVKTQKGVKSTALMGPIAQLLKTNSPENITQNLTVKLKPLSSYYLDTAGGAVSKTLAILSAVGSGILLLAIINFINIMIGTASYRLREIGLRKVFGSNRLQLICQYLAESVVLALFSGLVAIGIYLLLRPGFNQIWDTELPGIGDLITSRAALLLLFVLLTGILAGIYPSLLLSASSPVNAVKGKNARGEKGHWLRQSLLVLQFVLAAGIFIFSVTLSRQISYFFKKDQGYNRDQLLIVTALPKQWDSAGVLHMQQVRRAITEIPGVLDASMSFEVPDRSFNAVSLYAEGNDPKMAINIQQSSVDEHFARTYGLKLLEGRFFKSDGEAYTPNELVITASAAKALGLTNPVGKKILSPGSPQPVVIVGVTADFNNVGMMEQAKPIAMFHVNDFLSYRYMGIKLQGGHINETLEKVKARWKEISPGAPFDYSFMDEKFLALTSTELRLKKASAVATGLMILIVALGLFGLLSQSLARRKREMAVRKVLGAELVHIIALFVRQYMALILVSLVIAFPLAWFVTSGWLEQYAYRIHQSAWTYLQVGGAICLGTLILISIQCLKTALANPVDSLQQD